MKCAIYARVSDGRHQDASNQLAQLKSYADSKRWTVVYEYVDGDSGAKPDRPALSKLFDAASRREFDVVLVWALDRFTRQGVAQTFAYLKQLETFGVKFESFTEAHFRTTGEAGQLLISIAAWVAEQERKRIKERVAAGIARAKENGVKFGRPKATFHRDQVAVLREAGLTWNAISIKLGVPIGTCRRAFEASQAAAQKYEAELLETRQVLTGKIEPDDSHSQHDTVVVARVVRRELLAARAAPSRTDGTEQ